MPQFLFSFGGLGRTKCLLFLNELFEVQTRAIEVFLRPGRKYEGVEESALRVRDNRPRAIVCIGSYRGAP
jgi:hypothetical protein